MKQEIQNLTFQGLFCKTADILDQTTTIYVLCRRVLYMSIFHLYFVITHTDYYLNKLLFVRAVRTVIINLKIMNLRKG